MSEYGETQVRTTCSGVPGVPEFRTKRKLTEDKLTPQDDSFNERVERIAQAVGIEVTTGVLFTSTNKIEFSEKESETMSTSGNSAVDMESDPSPIYVSHFKKQTTRRRKRTDKMQSIF